jgi:hypothetical protein
MHNFGFSAAALGLPERMWLCCLHRTGLKKNISCHAHAELFKEKIDLLHVSNPAHCRMRICLCSQYLKFLHEVGGYP